MPRKPQPRKIPVGWRRLTPNEKIDANCNMTLTKNGPFFEGFYGISCANYDWCLNTTPTKHPEWIFIRPVAVKSPVSSVALTKPTDTSDGTKPANIETLG